MKNRSLAVSLSINVVLLGLLLWARGSHRTELGDLYEAAWTGDELHVSIHRMSLEALEEPNAEPAGDLLTLLRGVVDAGERNATQRDELRRAGVLKR